MGISTTAVIVIVIVCCLAFVSLGAAITRNWNPPSGDSRYQPRPEQDHYMRTVRMRNYNHLRQASMSAKEKDLESQCTFFPFCVICFDRLSMLIADRSR